MIDFIQANASWLAASTLALSYYKFVGIADDHLAPIKKDNVVLWLMGAYQGNWARSFCDVFDTLFSKNHFSPRCITISIAFSLVTTIVLFGLLGGSNEGISLRLGLNTQPLTLSEIVILALLVNAIPDYFSLYETRWLLGIFRDSDSIAKKALLLVLDALISGALIFTSINLFHFIRYGELIHLLELVAGLSIYSVFFYSTFITSVWAWVYAISGVVMRIASRGWLRDWLDIVNAPFKQIGLIGMPIVFVSALAFTNIMHVLALPDSKVDDFLCSIVPAAACDDAARLSSTNERRLEYMKRHCTEGKMDTCLDTGIEYLQIHLGEAIHLFIESCNLNDAAGCGFLAQLLERGEVEEGASTIYELYQKSCKLGEAHICAVFGNRLMEGEYMESNLMLSREVARRSCELDHAHGCVVLAIALVSGTDKKSHANEIQRLLQEACHVSSLISGCQGLAKIHADGDLPDLSPKELVTAHAKACELNSAESCRGAGQEYLKGEYVKLNLISAETLLERGCKLHDSESCASLGFAYSQGIGLKQDKSRAQPYLEKACSNDIGVACAQLGDDYADSGPKGMDIGLTLLNQGCELGIATGCTSLAHRLRASDSGDGELRFVSLYKKGCLLGLAVSCTTLADLYSEGIEIPKNPIDALEYFKAGCSLDSGYGCAQFGRLGLRGTSDKEELTNSIDSLKKSCELNFAYGCFALSRVLVSGLVGAAKEASQGLVIATKGCDLGYAQACHDTGSLHLTQQKYEIAQSFFELACKAGIEESCINANEVANRTK